MLWGISYTTVILVRFFARQHLSNQPPLLSSFPLLPPLCLSQKPSALPHADHGPLKPPPARPPQNISVFRAAGSPEAKTHLTWCVLYGIFPSAAAGVGASVLRLWWMRRPLPALRAAFEQRDSFADLKTVYRFRDTAQVRLLAGFLGWLRIHPG